MNQYSIRLKNWSTYSGLVTLLCLGFLLMPDSGYACTRTTVDTALESDSRMQSPTAKKTDYHKMESDRNCTDSCKDCPCRCIPCSPLSGLPVHDGLKAENQYIDIKEQKFGFKDAYYPLGGFSIWQPPKIG